MIAAVDGFLLGRVYVPVSQWAGARFGATAGSLARASLPPAAVFHAVLVYQEWAYDGRTITSCVVGVALILGLIAWFHVQAEEADMVPNPYALEPPVLRFVWFLIAAVTLSLFMGMAWNWLMLLCAALHRVAIISYIYFRACPPPPPKRLRRERLAFGAAT